MATGYDVSNLGAYTKDDADKAKLLYKAIATGSTASLMTVQPGIKTSERINIVTTDGVWQDQACSFTASAQTTFSQRTITVGDVAVMLKWCEKDLEAKYTQMAVKAGSNLDTLTYEQKIVEEILMRNEYNIETAIWNGDTLASSAYLNKFDGLKKIIAAATGVTVVTGASWSVANSRTRLQEFYAGLTNDMLVNPTGKIFMGTAECRDYRIKLGIDNLYHNDGKESKLMLENSDIEIIPTLGLSGSKDIYFIPTDQMSLGTDLLSEKEQFDLFYAKEAREFRFIMEFKLGVQVAHPTLICKMDNF
jgi:hypothetical protein